MATSYKFLFLGLLGSCYGWAGSSDRWLGWNNVLQEFAPLFAGHYSNAEQSLQDEASNVTGLDKHFWLQFFYVPVYIPALAPAVTFYYEQVISGSSSPARQQIYAFTQETRCSVRQATYDIADVSKLSTRTSGLRAVTSLTLSELSTRPECDAIWTRTEEDVYRSQLATDSCNFTFFGKEVLPRGYRELSCEGLTFVETFNQISDGSVVAGTEIPYVMELVGQRYLPPFTAVPGCVHRPCRPRIPMKLPTWAEIKNSLSLYGDHKSRKNSWWLE